MDLTDNILAADGRLHALIDQVLDARPESARLRQRILKTQGRLQTQVSEDAWVAYLDVEQAVNQRMNAALLAVARWAFTEGRRSVREGK